MDMKKVILLAAIGVGVAILLKKAKEAGYFDEVEDKANEYRMQAKRQLKNAYANAKNELEYMQDRAEYKFHKARG